MFEGNVLGAAQQDPSLIPDAFERQPIRLLPAGLLTSLRQAQVPSNVVPMPRPTGPTEACPPGMYGEPPYCVSGEAQLLPLEVEYGNGATNGGFDPKYLLYAGIGVVVIGGIAFFATSKS